MLITIYGSAGQKKAEVSPNDSSTQVKEVQGDSVLTLSFTHFAHIDLDVNDYADFLGERYWLNEKYRPKQNSLNEWAYDIKLYGIESMIKRLLVINTVDEVDEPEFTLTAPPREHVGLIVKCMNGGMGNTDWKVGQVEGTENIVIDYFGKYCNEALKEIAEKVGGEWWIEGQTVNICKCEHGEPIYMGYDKGLLSIDPGTADNVKFYTRLYPVGSSRNIDRDKYGFTRLQLPGGQKYVEMNAEKYGRVDHYEKDAFADIYPRRIGRVSNVRSEVKTGEDGKPFTIYYFSDNSLPFDPNAYEIGGLVKRVSFQEGSELAGLGEEDNGTYYFEVNFNSTTREFEIITIWPYDNDMQLPGGSLIPKIGNNYILWNLSMPDEYYELAEAEFMSAVDKYNADHNLDISVYKAPTDHVWIEDNEIELTIGQRIRLESDEYFPETGYRDSRITKITRKVNLPSSMDIEISDALSRTAQEKMSDSISDVRSYAKAIGESTNLPGIIRSWDNTLPTDNNLFSARRSQKEFLNKNVPDKAKEPIIFEKGLDTTGIYSPGKVSGVNGKGLVGQMDDAGKYSEQLDDLLVREQVVTNKIVSPGAVSGVMGDGLFAELKDNGAFSAHLDELLVRSKMVVMQLMIQEVKSVGGVLVVSRTGAKVKRVSPWSGGWTAVLESTDAEPFIVGDLIRMSRWDDANNTLRSYWGRVSKVGTAVDGLRTVESLTNDFVPLPGDEFVLMGSENPGRSGFLLISVEDGQPRIDVYNEVTQPTPASLRAGLKARLGDLSGINDPLFPEMGGYGLYSQSAFLSGQFHLNSKSGTSPDASRNLLLNSAQLNKTFNPQANAQTTQVKTSVQMVKGQTYTLRFITSLPVVTDARYENGVSIGAVRVTDSGSLDWVDNGAIAKPYPAGTYCQVFKWDLPTGYYRIYVTNSTEAVTLSDVMLVCGNNIAAEWSEAPEDTKAKTMQAIIATDVLYKQGTSLTIAPTPLPTIGASGDIANYNGWASQSPAWEADNYIWQTTYVKRGNGDATFSNPTCISGKNGVGIDHIEEEYCLSTSSSSPTPNVWYDEEHKPTWVAGKYMWTRSHVYYTDGTDETFGEVCVTGATGASVLAQYSATGGSNASEWHPTFVSGDIWMRTSSDGGQNWNPAIRIVGQNGANYTPNLALKTSEAWLAPESVFGNGVNLTSSMYNVYGLKTGDTFTVSFDYEATELDFNRSGAYISFQFGPDYKWLGFNFYIKQNGRGRFVRTAVLTGEGITETVNGKPLCRFDYMSKNSGGSFRIWNFKVEKGANENPEWTPAASEMVGKDGKWRKYQWGVTTSSTTANGITDWQDTPMTAPAGQYVWMRSGIVTPPATEPTSYDPATRLTGDKGADGQSVYMLDLSNEVMGILCDSSGAVTGQYSTSQACVWKGSEKLTSGITYSIAQTGGVSATVTPAGLVTPSALTKDNATIVVQAVVGSVTLQSTITLYKVKAGANGANGTNGANYSPNLMLNTDFSKGTKYWNMGTGGGFSNPQNTCTIDTAIKHEGRDSVKIVAAGNETAVWWGLGVKRENVPTLQIKGGQTITLSFWICTDNLASIDDKAACEIACYNASGSKVNGGYTPITPTKNAVWEKRVLTFTTGSDVVSIAPWIYVGKNGRIWVSSIKVEIGNNPNPQWTPASSEMVGVNGADAVVYSLEPSVDNITKSMTGELSATSVTCTVYKTTGNSQRVRTSEKQVSYQVIKSDGTTLTGTKTPTDGVTSEVTVTPDTEAIIWELKGDNNVLLDRERVPVLADASDLEVGGTNLARGTSEAWFAPDIAFSNQQNRTVNAYDVYGLKTGDTFTVSFDYEVVGVSFGSNSAFNLQFNGWGWIGRGKIITVNSKGHYTLTRELTTADITEETNGLFGFRFDYLSRSSGGYIKIWNVKVEKGNVETAWAPAPQDTAGKIEAITTEITNINNQIDLAVKKNDLTVAGINLSTDGVTITGNKTTIKGNDGKTYAMFSEIDGVPVLDANLINARTFVARDADGNPLTSFNLEGDGIIRHYYPGTSQRQYESGVVTITVVDENNKITPITTVGRYYAEDDSLLWWLSPEGLDKPQLPYYFETLMLTQNGLINTDTDLSAYATPYQVLRSTSEATCAVHGLHSYRTHDGETFKNAQSIESTNLIPNGTYYSPTLVKAINPPTTLGLGTGVINPEQQIIGYRYRYDFHNGRCAAPMLYVIYKDNTAVEVL